MTVLEVDGWDQQHDKSVKVSKARGAGLVWVVKRLGPVRASSG
jgi:hypothetical protein